MQRLPRGLRGLWRSQTEQGDSIAHQAAACRRRALKYGWAAVITVQALAGWISENCTPAGRFGPLVRDLAELIRSQQTSPAPNHHSVEGGQSRETR